ncbi:MAG: response regulator [Anaerolineales bacterium]|nr:response regulator [Anaerolineales bacterium]
MEKKPLGYIVEDYEDTANVFSWALEMAGYEVEVAKDGAVAQKRLAEIVPDLIILDLHIPHVSGDKLLKLIRSDKRLSKTRVFLATADANMASQLMDQAELVLLKPISLMQLRELAERFRPDAQE